MKKITISILILVISVSAGAQVRMSKTLTMDTLARLHEIQINPSIVLPPVLTGRLPALYGVDISYARVYKGTHRLRSGLSYYRTGSTNYGEVNYQWTADSSTTRMRITGRNSNAFFARLGYEVSLGKRKTRFLLGADLYLGFRRETFGEYYGTFILNTITENYTYNILMYGIKPRIGLRYEFSKLFAGGLALGFLVAGESFLPYTKETYIEKEPLPELLKSEKLKMGGPGINFGYLPELNLIFKIPEKKK